MSPQETAFRRAGDAGWGGVARRGAAGINAADPVERARDAGASRRSPRAPRPGREDESARARPERPPKPERPPRPERPTARYAVTGDGAGFVRRPDEDAPRRARKRLPAPVATELAEAGSPREVARLELRLGDATRAYQHDRYAEALSSLRELARSAPGVAAIRELLGLTYYRLGRWKEAARELTAFADLTGSVDQHPVIADCERALGHHARVDELWAELRRAGAGSDVLAEGRLVEAGSLADRGRLGEAIDLLVRATAGKEVRKPLDRHVRQWYALADLYEKSGDLPEARQWFSKVVAADPDLADAPERLAALR